MPKLPGVLDFGARPSLRSNRVDPVHDGSVVADSVARASEQFARIYGEVKEKQNRLSYALAKNELTALDISNREALKDRDDWQAFDQEYTSGFNTGRDEIIGRYALSPTDRSLLQSESELIRERGRVYANDLARGKEIDQGRSQVMNDLDKMQEMIQVAPPEQQTELMLDALETIRAASDPEGKTPYFTEEEAQTQIQAFVAKSAISSLETMDAEDRVKELELSLAHRKARGAVTREDIAEGKGSGSVADFLHANVATKMLEAAKKENEIDEELAAAQALLDDVMDANPGDDTAIVAETRRLARETGMEPKARERALSMARQAAEEIRVGRNSDRAETMITMGNLLQEQDEEGNFLHSFDDLPARQLRDLTPQQIAQLRAFEGNVRNGSQFGRSTNWRDPSYNADGQLEVPSYSAWVEMTPAQKAEVDLESPEWYNNFELPVWKQMADEQERIRSGGLLKEKSIQTNDQILTDVWAGEIGLPRTGRSEDEDQMYYLMRSRMVSEVDRLSDEKYGGQAVPDAERKEIARRLLSSAIFKRDAGKLGWIHKRDAKKPVAVAEADPDEFDEYFVPIDQWRHLETTMEIGGERVPTTWEERLKNKASAHLDGRKPTTKDLENAYAQIIIGGDPQDVERRVLDALAGKHEY